MITQMFHISKTISRLLEDTYTNEEVEDILNNINEMIETEAESELMAASHTNVLLLQQIFTQAQKWHLDLEADLAELENKELLDKVKRWEDSELSSQKVEDGPLLIQKKLAPLNEGGPMQLLKAQVRCEIFREFKLGYILQVQSESKLGNF